MEKLFEKMGELKIFGIHNFGSVKDNEVIQYYEDFELNIDKELKLSQLRELTMFLYKKNNIDKEYEEEAEGHFNKYIEELGDISIKVIFDIGFMMENDGYNQENIAKFNSIRVYDDNINKNITGGLILFLMKCGYGSTLLVDIDYVIDSNENNYESIFKILGIKSLRDVIEKNYQLNEVVFNYGAQRVLLFFPKEIYNKKLEEEIENGIRDLINQLYL